jgi:hypothetical protein
MRELGGEKLDPVQPSVIEKAAAKSSLLWIPGDDLDDL